jgi:nucleoside phosphorylase
MRGRQADKGPGADCPGGNDCRVANTCGNPCLVPSIVRATRKKARDCRDAGVKPNVNFLGLRSVTTRLLNMLRPSAPALHPTLGERSLQPRYQAPFGWKGRTRIAIVTIIDEEFAAARALLGLNEVIPGTGYFVAKVSDNRTYDVVLMQATDRSNIPAFGDTTALMEDLRPQVIILLGVAGGLCDDINCGRDGIRPGDVLIADQVSYVEFLKVVPAGPLMRSFAIDHPSIPLRKRICIPIQKTFRFADHLQVTPPKSVEPKVVIGGIVSGEKVLGDVKSHIQNALLKPFDKALAVDMESIGVARAICEGRSSFWYHPRYLVIRGISDLVSADDNDSQRSDWKPFAAHTAALVVREFIARLPIDEGVD